MSNTNVTKENVEKNSFNSEKESNFNSLPPKPEIAGRLDESSREQGSESLENKVEYQDETKSQQNLQTVLSSDEEHKEVNIVLDKDEDSDLQLIEVILSEDLEYIEEALPEKLRKQFDDKKIETAKQIKVLVNKAKVNLKKIVKLIVDWLKMIPGINKFFLEQEAKIKADKIIKSLTQEDKI